MKREILISGTPRETRVAILEDDRLVELLVDRPDQRRTVGDIYFGRVEAVLGGIQAAFVDIGMEKSAYLHASDLLEPEDDDDPEDRDDDESPDPETDTAEAGESADVGEPATAIVAQTKRRGDGGRREIGGWRAIPDIAERLKKGEMLPVQVTKEPISTKGCRVTAQISLAGRFLVYMPYATKVGVSRKIENREQRA